MRMPRGAQETPIFVAELRAGLERLAEVIGNIELEGSELVDEVGVDLVDTFGVKERQEVIGESPAIVALGLGGELGQAGVEPFRREGVKARRER